MKGYIVKWKESERKVFIKQVCINIKKLLQAMDKILKSKIDEE